MDILLKGGKVVSGRGVKEADVLIKGEKIAKVGKNLSDKKAEVVDVKGKLLFPGFIDAHTHFDLDVCNTTTADDFTYGSKAAIRGGTTCVIDFACPNKGETLQYGLELWHKKADDKSYCDYSFHMTIDDWNESIEKEIDNMAKEGITSYKMYMTYPAMMVGDENIYHALMKLKQVGGICGFHCENADIINARIKDMKAKGLNSVGCHPEARPDYCEAEAVSRLLRIAQSVDIPVVVVHCTNEEVIKEIEKARARGQKVYAETCPHYLTLDDSVYYNKDWLEAAKYVCAPPMRKKSDCKYLWKAIRQGKIQTVSTDHCSFTTKQKLAGKDDFTTIPGGMPGVETRGEIMYTYGVGKKNATEAMLCRVMCENPAKLYGMYGKKGIIKADADADIVVYDPKKDHVITAADMVSKCDYTPFEGVKTVGSIAKVYLRGHLMVEDGKVLGGMEGKYVKRKKNMLK